MHDKERVGHRLIQLGVTLFLVGLLIGLAVPVFANPRMGLASHLEGVMNGMFLVLLGVIWPRLDMGPRGLAATFWLAMYGTFSNVLATLLAAAWGAGSMMPLAAGSQVGTPAQEVVIRVLLVSLALAMVAVCVLVLVGLRRPGRADSR